MLIIDFLSAISYFDLKKIDLQDSRKREQVLASKHEKLDEVIAKTERLNLELEREREVYKSVSWFKNFYTK